jgi:Methylamine utilisation protein MauE
MASIASVSALIVSLTLVWAAIAKLRNPASGEDAFAQLGFASLARFHRLVPLIEIVIAGGLLIRPRIGGGAALVLFIVFTVALASALRRANGATIHCGCFGAHDHSPVTSTSIVRNVMLMMLCVLSFGAARFSPDIAGVIAIGSAIATGLMVMSLIDLRRATGSVFNPASQPGNSTRSEQ